MFDFVRINKCWMEFQPRANMSQITTEQNVTFLTGMDEIPLVTSTSPGTTAPTWGAQGGDDATVTEANAFDSARITADYLRGMKTCKETQCYKKHVVSFYPAFYNLLDDTVSTTAASHVVERNIKKWVNLNWINQSTGTDVQSLGPDFYGPMYCFSSNNNVGAAQPYYDVKLHYSVSFRRLRGV